MNITPEVVKHIKEQETFMPEPYTDLGGRLAIGYGHSILRPPKVELGMVWTEEQAAQVLHDDLEYSGKMVLHYLTQDISSFNYGACASLLMNIGPGNFKKSNVCRFINSPEITYNTKKAAVAFLEHNRAKDNVTQEVRPFLGLTVRRIVEAALFLRKETT